MYILSEEKAVGLLKKTIREQSALRIEDSVPWETWLRNLYIRIEAIFGSKSKQMSHVTTIGSKLLDANNIFYKEKCSKRLLAALQSFCSEIQDLWPNKNRKESTGPTTKTGKTKERVMNTRKSLKKSAKLRLSVTVAIFLISEGIVIYLASIYGEGPNLFQRVLNSWPFLGIAIPAITILIGSFYIGRKRLEILGWPIMRVFRHE